MERASSARPARGGDRSRQRKRRVSAHLPWGEEGVVLGAGAVLPLQPGGYGGGGRRHRSGGPAPTVDREGVGIPSGLSAAAAAPPASPPGAGS